jgi:hypothetical protein
VTARTEGDQTSVEGSINLGSEEETVEPVQSLLVRAGSPGFDMGRSQKDLDTAVSHRAPPPVPPHASAKLALPESRQGELLLLGWDKASILLDLLDVILRQLDVVRIDLLPVVNELPLVIARSNALGRTERQKCRLARR